MLHALLAGCAACSVFWLVALLVNLAALPRLSRQAPASGNLPFVSIVVPARNEERAIGSALRSLLAQDYPESRREVIVVDDRSTDGTRRVLAGLENDPGLKIIDGAEPPPGWLGKPHALFQGSRAARGEWLLFVDADVRYRPDAVSRAMGYALRERTDFAALLPHLETSGFWESVLMPNLLCAVFFGPAVLANRRWPRWLAAGGGAGNLIRRAAYDAIGGHESLRASVIDDVRLAVMSKQAGFATRTVLAHELVAVRMYHGFREVWDGFTKNIAYALGGVTGFAFAGMSLVWTAVALSPPAVLMAAAFGASLPAADVALAGASFGVLVFARALLSKALHDPVWPSLTHPLMAAVWAGLLVRSVYQRLVRRTVPWRGRHFDARKAGF
ncbi:MAG: glycosyltransferase [Acidobacteria bacterium]|nr:glycosyltransferase [Acidobacteriota bacterium]